MSLGDRIGSYFIASLGGILFTLIMLLLTGTTYVDGYRNGVKDHMNGRTNIELQTDTIISIR